jgi:hypothetical protein
MTEHFVNTQIKTIHTLYKSLTSSLVVGSHGLPAVLDKVENLRHASQLLREWQSQT